MIERNCGALITDHTDAITRAALLNLPRQVALDNLVSMPDPRRILTPPHATAAHANGMLTQIIVLDGRPVSVVSSK